MRLMLILAGILMAIGTFVGTQFSAEMGVLHPGDARQLGDVVVGALMSGSALLVILFLAATVRWIIKD